MWLKRGVKEGERVQGGQKRYQKLDHIGLLYLLKALGLCFEYDGAGVGRGLSLGGMELWQALQEGRILLL